MTLTKTKVSGTAGQELRAKNWRRYSSTSFGKILKYWRKSGVKKPFVLIIVYSPATSSFSV